MVGIIRVRRMSHWCLIFLLLEMNVLPVFIAKEPVPVDIYTGVYNNSLVSSCLPTDSRNISAVHKTFVNLLRGRDDTDAIWLPIQRRDLGGWYWLSGEFEELPSLSHEYCAVLRATDMVLAHVVCDRQYHKYLCQKTDSSCRVSDGNCFVDAGTQYTIVEGLGSWYDARTGCYERGEQLASLPKAYRTHFLEKIQGMTKVFPDIWVGLRRIDYFIVKESASVEAFNWRKGDTCPCNSPHSCLALERTEKNDIFWKPRNCSDWIPSIVCDQRKRHVEATTKGQEMAGGEEFTTNGQVGSKTGNAMCVSVVVTLLGTFVLLTVMLIYMLYHVSKTITPDATNPGRETNNERRVEGEGTSARGSVLQANGVPETVQENERGPSICKRRANSGSIKWAWIQHFTHQQNILILILYGTFMCMFFTLLGIGSKHCS